MSCREKGRNQLFNRDVIENGNSQQSVIIPMISRSHKTDPHIHFWLYLCACEIESRRNNPYFARLSKLSIVTGVKEASIKRPVELPICQLCFLCTLLKASPILQVQLQKLPANKAKCTVLYHQSTLLLWLGVICLGWVVDSSWIKFMC